MNRPVFRIESTVALKNLADQMMATAIDNPLTELSLITINKLIELGLNRFIWYKGKTISIVVTLDNIPGEPFGKHVSLGMVSDRVDDDSAKEIVNAFFEEYQEESFNISKVRHFFEKQDKEVR
jgi:hypothetical protein